MGMVSKIRTLWRYTLAAWTLGDSLVSRWVLATLLPRLKFHLLDEEKVYEVWIRIGSVRRTLYLRPCDIFVVYEVLWSNPYILPEMLRKPPRCILDLGAHIGLATLRFKATFPEAIIHCYEPDPENFRLLERNTKGLPGVVLHQDAVGPEDTTATLYVLPGRHSASSLRRPPEEMVFREVLCKVSTLDSILANLGLPVDLLKFDIEGIEYEVFSSSRRVQEVPWIVGELKGETGQIKRFVRLFPHHCARLIWLTQKMALVYLWREC